MIRKPPVKRAFTGLVGLPPEPDEKPEVSPPPAESPAPAAPQKSNAALRAERYRARQRANDPQFNERERVRKEQERAEKDRAAQIAAVLAEKEPELTVVNAEGKTVRVISGGYGSRRIAEVDDKSEQVEVTDGRKVVVPGAAPANFDADAEKERRTKEHDNQFVRKSFQHVRAPREVKAMNAFIYTNVQRYNHKSELTVCSHCKAELTPFPSYVPLLAFQHFHDAHPKLFQTMMAKVQNASEKPMCTVDHAAMVREHGRGDLPVQCHRCSKIVWRPGDNRRKRSDKSKPELAPVNG